MKNKTGKIKQNFLKEFILQKTGAFSSSIIQGPKLGVDTAIIQLSTQKGLVVATDPTTLIPSLGLKESAYLSVTLTANDLATSGCTPQYAQFMLDLDESLTDQELKEYWNYIHFYCENYNISITGGHTGFSKKGGNTISGAATMFSEVNLDSVKSTAHLTPGLTILMTESAAYASAAILAKTFPNYVQRHLGTEIQKKLSQQFFNQSILKPIEYLKSNQELFSGIIAFHDVTEGGILGACYEMFSAGDVGGIIDQQQIFVRTEEQKLCDLFSICPLRSLGTGGLLIACKPDWASSILKILHSKQIPAHKIGTTQQKDSGKKLYTPSQTVQLTHEEDPYWKAFFNAQSLKLNES